MEKTFRFDVVIDEQDMCNREEEKKRLLSVMQRAGRIVVYSQRRMGKTSLANVACQKMKKATPEAFHIFVDLNEVASLSEVAARFRSHYEMALKEQFPVQNVKLFLSTLASRVKLGLPGGVAVSFEKYSMEKPEHYLMSLFNELKEMSLSRPIVLTIDEFQGIAELKNVQAILRREFQQLTKAAVILMGSNQRLLYKMLNNKKLPFFGFGEDMELHEIPVKDYEPYMNDRFAEKGIHISEKVAIHMMELMNNIPNYINELGAWIVDTFSNIELSNEHIDIALDAAAKSKRGRYESALYGYTQNQRQFIKVIARSPRGVSLTGKDTQEQTNLSATELSRIKGVLEDCPLLSLDTQNRLFVIDPFLKKFLQLM